MGERQGKGCPLAGVFGQGSGITARGAGGACHEQGWLSGQCLGTGTFAFSSGNLGIGPCGWCGWRDCVSWSSAGVGMARGGSPASHQRINIHQHPAQLGLAAF